MEINKNPYFRKSIYLLVLMGLAVLFFGLYRNQNAQICNEVSIAIDAPIEQQLITTPIIQDYLDEWFSGGLSGVQKKDLSLHIIEDKIENLPAVESAQVSFDLRGVMKIDITQKVPIVRIYNGSTGGYYLGQDGSKIPVEGHEVARVPIATGGFSQSMIKKVYTLAAYVHENPFIKALTEQIFVNKNRDLVLIPKIKNQRIIVGDTIDLDQKFSKLQDFYTYGLNQVGWEKYKSVNLKYKNQIVCK